MAVTETMHTPPNPQHAALEGHMDKTMKALINHKEKEAILKANATAAHQALLDAKHPSASHGMMGWGSRKDHRGRTVGGRKKRRRRRHRRRTQRRRKRRTHRRRRTRRRTRR